jgi:SAM-dependent MidA family methyltransferase
MLTQIIADAIQAQGGWLGFDGFMRLALYAPGLGYYDHGSPKFGHLPESGSDFVTAPELTPLFGQSLAVAVSEAMGASQTDEVWEFGAGSGALAEQLLGALGARLRRYTIVDLSGSLRERQQARLAPFADKVRWLTALPEHFNGVVVGNEVLDAMPVQLLVRRHGEWFERGVALAAGVKGPAVFNAPPAPWVWADRPTRLRPSFEVEGEHDYLTETHAQGEAFVRTLADRLERGVVFLLDYGFPEAEYYHPQRISGTVMCHQGHRADTDPLVAVGDKDITAHVNFTGVALAAQEAGLNVVGYTSQAHFLFNCGLMDLLQTQHPGDVVQHSRVLKLVNEHEMGEIFKVLCLSRGTPVGWDSVGFKHGDRTHRL